MNNTAINELSNRIVVAAVDVHRNLGPGLLEHTYQAAIAYDLSVLGLLIN